MSYQVTPPTTSRTLSDETNTSRNSQINFSANSDPIYHKNPEAESWEGPNGRALWKMRLMLVIYRQMVKVKRGIDKGLEQYWIIHRCGRQPCPCR